MKRFLFLLLVGFHSFGEAKNYTEIFEKYKPDLTYNLWKDGTETKKILDATKEYIEENLKRTSSLEAAAEDLLKFFKRKNYSPLELSFLLPILGDSEGRGQMVDDSEKAARLIIAKAAALIDQGALGLEKVTLNPEQLQQWETNIAMTVLESKCYIDIFEGPLFENSEKLCQITRLNDTTIKGHLDSLTSIETCCNSFLTKDILTSIYESKSCVTLPTPSSLLKKINSKLLSSNKIKENSKEMNVVRAFTHAPFWIMQDFKEKTPYFENKGEALKRDARTYILNKYAISVRSTFEDFLKNWETLTDPSWWKFSGNPILLDEIDTIKRELLEEKVDYSSGRGFNWLFRHCLELQDNPCEPGSAGQCLSYKKAFSTFCMGKKDVKIEEAFWDVVCQRLKLGEGWVLDAVQRLNSQLFNHCTVEHICTFLDQLCFARSNDMSFYERNDALDTIIDRWAKSKGAEAKKRAFKFLMESLSVGEQWNFYSREWVERFAPPIEDQNAGNILYMCNPGDGLAQQKIPGVFFTIICDTSDPVSKLNTLLKTWEKGNKQILAQNARPLLFYGASRMICHKDCDNPSDIIKRMDQFQELIETLMDNFTGDESDKKKNVLYGSREDAKNLFEMVAIDPTRATPPPLKERCYDNKLTILDYVEHLWEQALIFEHIDSKKAEEYQELVDTIKKWHDQFASDLPLRAADYESQESSWLGRLVRP